MWRGMAIGVVLLASTGCIVHVRQGSGDPVSETRPLDAFSGVISAHQFDVNITIGDAQDVVVFCDDNLLDTVVTTVEDGDLVIRRVRTDGPFVQIDPTVTCAINVVAVDPERVASTGSGLVTLDGRPRGGIDTLSMVVSSGSGGVDVLGAVSAPMLEVHASGSGRVDLESVVADAVLLDASGSGGLEVSDGTTAQLEVHVSGSGSVDAQGLDAADVRVTSSGSGSVEVTATRSLEAHISGSGGVSVWGSPAEREVDATGSGQVSFQDY